MNERMRVVLLLAVAMLVYGNTLLNSFTMDDELYIFRNPAVTSPSLKALFEATKFTNIFRPATFESFALNWAIGGAHPFGYHLFNLLLHAMVTLLLFLALRKLLEPAPRGALVAWVAALLFAVHPIHTEAVASIVGRSELLAVGFLLAAWLLHMYDRPILVLVCFLLALLSKESAVVFVPLVLAGDYARGMLKPLFRYASIAGTAAMYMALLWKVQGGRFGGKSVHWVDNPLAYLPASLRIPNALRIAWKYVGLQVYPSTLSCDYSYNAILLYVGWRHTALAVIAALVVLALWIWALRTQRKEWFLAGAIYLIGFAVTANILVPMGTIMAERLVYLPSAGFCLLVALIWTRLEERNWRPAWTLLMIIVVALGARTMVRNRDWRDNFTLFSAAVEAVPESAKMHSNLAFQYYYRGQVEAASKELQTALRIYPDMPDDIGFKALIEAGKGRNQEARGLLQNALSMTTKESPSYDFIAVNLAAVLIKLGENDDALKLLNEEISKSPGLSRAWSNRAVIRYAHGEVASSREDAQTALRLDPGNTQAQNLLDLLNKSGPLAPEP
jgi:tetratricopeptide (TPR) repeat protein